MAAPQTEPPYNSAQDANQVNTLILTTGTVGTADVLGTAEVMRASGNPITGAQYVEQIGGTNINILSGSINGTFSNTGTNVNIVTGSQQTLGTVGTVIGLGSITNLPQISIGTIPFIQGTVSITNPSGTVVTVDHGTITVNGAIGVSQGTVILGAAGNVIGNIGTLITGTLAALAAGTITGGTLNSISSLPQISVGTLPVINISSGTQQTLGTVGVVNSGTINQITTVSSLTNGSVNILSGSILGTILGGTINQGTMLVQGISASNGGAGFNTILAYSPSDADGNDTGLVVNTNTRLWNGTKWFRARGDVTNGMYTTVFGGTIGNLNAGTITRAGNVGTVESGTIQINKNPVIPGTPTHVRGTTGAAVWGTLIAGAGAGNKQYISNVDIVVLAGTVDVAVTNIGVGGSTGAGIMARGQFVPSAGITKAFDPLCVSGTNGTIAYWLGGAGTVDIIVTGYITT